MLSTQDKTKKTVSDSLEFPWDAFEIVLGGKSAIDVGFAFQSDTLEKAGTFYSAYGFDTTNPIESAEAFGHFHEAINFIRKNFLKPENPQGLESEIPKRIFEVKSPEELLVMVSSDKERVIHRLWACAILKVMHTLAHMDLDNRASNFGQIQTQLLDPYYKMIERDEQGQMVFAKQIPLVAFESKPKKSRESLLIKLLHKPENVAEDVFDRVGIRFVTKTKLDALKLVKVLIEKRIVIPPNLKPSRSRNSLVDLEFLKSLLDKLPENIEDAQSLLEIENSLNAQLDAVENRNQNAENKHTKDSYRSIQFTCRQLIKLVNPIYQDLRLLKSTMKKYSDVPTEVVKVIERIELSKLNKESKFFYPYEVQVVDHSSHLENEKGRSAHSEYKKAQLMTALKRVMGPLARAT